MWNKTTNVVEFYPKTSSEFDASSSRPSRLPTGGNRPEDDDIGERMDRHLALMKEGRNEVASYQSPYEDGCSISMSSIDGHGASHIQFC